MVCTFIGHRDTPREVKSILKALLIKLINQGVCEFYVGTHGSFDNLALTCLEELQKEFTDIKYIKVLAYLPQSDDGYTDYSNTVYPEGLENVPPKFAIKFRDEYMIKKADFLICYVKQNITNAGQFMKFAERRGKKIINIAKGNKWVDVGIDTTNEY